MRIPFCNKGNQPFSQVVQVGEVADTQPLALQDAEPLPHLIHPGAMHRQKPTDKARMGLEPSLDLFTCMHTGVIEDHPDATNGRWNLPIQLGEQGNELFLPLAHLRSSVDLPRASTDWLTNLRQLKNAGFTQRLGGQ
jgi:hypothetical protein